MKRMMLAALLLAALGLSAGAQTVTRTQDLTEMNAIKASQAFEVTVLYAESPRVEWTVDEVLEDYVKVYTMKKELVLAYEEKLVPKDVRKAYKAKNAAKPTFRVTVWCPRLEEITLADNVVLACNDILRSDSFKLDMGKNSQLLRLEVHAKQAQLKLAGKATANLVVNARELSTQTANSSSLTLRQHSESLSVAAEGSSKQTISGKTVDLDFATKGYSKLVVSGEAKTLKAQGAGNSEVDAINLPVSEAELVLVNSSDYLVHAADRLKLDIAGGSSVLFSGNPVFDIVRIVNSTVRRYGDSRK